MKALIVDDNDSRMVSDLLNKKRTVHVWNQAAFFLFFCSSNVAEETSPKAA